MLFFNTNSNWVHAKLNPNFSLLENVGNTGNNWEQLGKIGRKWEQVGTARETRKKWEKVGTARTNWGKVGKSGNNWEHLGNIRKQWEQYKEQLAKTEVYHHINSMTGKCGGSENGAWGKFSTDSYPP